MSIFLVGGLGINHNGEVEIASALYHNPVVLIFDEATSALDNQAEQLVMEAIHSQGWMW